MSDKTYRYKCPCGECSKMMRAYRLNGHVFVSNYWHSDALAAGIAAMSGYEAGDTSDEAFVARDKIGNDIDAGIIRSEHGYVWPCAIHMFLDDVFYRHKEYIVRGKAPQTPPTPDIPNDVVYLDASASDWEN